MRPYFTTLILFIACSSQSQSLQVHVSDERGVALGYATVQFPSLSRGGYSDSSGTVEFRNLPAGQQELSVALVGYFAQKMKVTVPGQPVISVKLVPQWLKEVVITGTMKEVIRSESPISVEIITPKLFRRNPSPNLFEAIGMVSGVQPVIGCNVCNTGDIHINGMEGPYTLVLMDGMPIVSGLGTVYGLMGIPNSLIERVEVVKGPAGALYGSEAMAGMINVITKSAAHAPRLSAEIFGTTWGEINADVGVALKAGKNARGLLGINTFLYDRPLDNNRDGFTDLTLQKRVSVFNKWQWARPHDRLAQLGARYVWEDRWGGQMNWTPAFRGGDSIYGESIYTHRLELFGTYQLPLQERIFTQYSFNTHRQNSVYGSTLYLANQDIGFVQTYWDKTWRQHDGLLGAALRYTRYDDNTPATILPDIILLPGIFVQDEWKFASKYRLLSGLRTDFHPIHGVVWSPRMALRYTPNDRNTLRASLGSGFRVVNLFTEEHAALTGARSVVLAEALEPERSWSGNLNWNARILRPGWFLSVDATGFYTYFTNRILPDYDTDPNLIIYKNLNGHAATRGVTLQLDYTDALPLKLLLGVTFMDVFQVTPNADGILKKMIQIHAPAWSGTWSANYTHPKSRVSVDCTGNWYGPQRLPILPNDFRPEFSPWFALLNLQVSRKFLRGIELYGGVKNLLNFVPKDPIMRPFDPFDKNINDSVNNPNGYTFDPSYNYAPLQGIRGFAGARWNW